MKKTRAVSLLLSLTMMASLAIPGTLPLSVNAAGDQEDQGMVIDKYAEANQDGSYKITLEAYATGETFTTEIKEEIPTDIILVLDQSGSMADSMSSYSFEPYEDETNRWGTIYHTRNEDYYTVRHNGGSSNLWYPLEDGSYVSVSVIRTEGTMSYTRIDQGRNNSTGSWGNIYTSYWSNQNNLYALVDGTYQKVTVERIQTGGNRWSPIYTYTYTLPDGTVIASSIGDTASPSFTDVDGNMLYLASVDENTYQYTYTYTDDVGETHTIGTSVGATTVPEFGPFYEYAEGSISRLNALKNAVTGFVNNVNTKAAGDDGQLGTEDDVNHRVAVVGFATGDYTENSSDYPTYQNTEVFIGSTQYNYSSGDINDSYSHALQDMNTQDGYNNVIASKDSLEAKGATYPNFGLKMAKNILDANPLQEGEVRNRVVILFTDGVPGWSSYDSKVASEAITEAAALKNGNVTVYSVGIFDGADASKSGNTGNYSSNADKGNYFCQNVSSNNGTPQNPSYYLSAADADTLNSIFKQISDQIQQGGSSATLDESTMIKDMIAPSFTLPEGATASDITLETYQCTGEETWSKNDSAMGAVAAIDGDSISVTGFDFADNWCGTETANSVTVYRGNKLVISFDVVPKEGFLGGNDVPTNTMAGVYEDNTAETPVLTFPEPIVNVPMKNVTVQADDKNVYLLSDITVSDLGASVSAGDIVLNLNEDNYGLEAWQNAYVDIEVKIMDNEGNEFSGLENLTEDTTYSVEATVTPKTSATTSVGEPNSMEGVTDNDTGHIYVYKPTVTFRDSEVWYGDDAPMNPDDYMDKNYVSTVWKHGETESTSVAMTGEEPGLIFEYLLSENVFSDGRIDTKEDIPVNVAVKIDDTAIDAYTTFAHADCTHGNMCGFDASTEEFLLHVNTCSLTIIKTGGADDETYIFDIRKDGADYTFARITGNDSITITELPVGDYTVSEDTDWSWRYESTMDPANGNVSLGSIHPSHTVTCTNTKENDYWLNDYSAAAVNTYGGGNN